MDRVGVDLGGTKTEAVLVDEDVNVLGRRRVPTPQGGYDEILAAVADLVAGLAGGGSDYALGICTPGAVSRRTGLIRNSNTQALTGRSIRDDLQETLAVEVTHENDGNCFALAEASLGAAREYESVFGAVLGTGVGGGIVTGRRLHRGRNLIAGEWGHHVLHRGGRPCYCGKSGCVETYLSGPALESRWAEFSGSRAPLPEILESVESRAGREWRDELLENFGHALANVIDILDPDVVVLGGGLSNIGFLYSEGRDSVYDKVFSDHIDTPIIPNQLGDSAGVFGAALLI